MSLTKSENGYSTRNLEQKQVENAVYSKTYYKLTIDLFAYIVLYL